jgi:hypothetical protein
VDGIGRMGMEEIADDYGRPFRLGDRVGLKGVFHWGKGVEIMQFMDRGDAVMVKVKYDHGETKFVSKDKLYHFRGR